MGLGEMLRRSLDKLVLTVAGKPAKAACGKLHLCAGFGAGIEGATHSVGQRRMEISRARQREEEARIPVEE